MAQNRLLNGIKLCERLPSHSQVLYVWSWHVLPVWVSPWSSTELPQSTDMYIRWIQDAKLFLGVNVWVSALNRLVTCPCLSPHVYWDRLQRPWLRVSGLVNEWNDYDWLLHSKIDADQSVLSDWCNMCFCFPIMHCQYQSLYVIYSQQHKWVFDSLWKWHEVELQ